MYELPPDPQRLRVIRLYLQMQIAAVDAKIQEAESGSAPVAAGAAEAGGGAPQRARGVGGARTPARAWRLQSVPDPGGGSGRGVLHRDDCRVPGGGRLNRQEFEVALGMPDVTSCGVCRPEAEPAS
ncbi:MULTISPECIES: DUF6233 domain-containing protein [Streptomycetaceae]|uniref:DUF6233 domain-containing protein n=1 Tax=Streptomycetaceae TaxID=2062 RepID=UPI00036694EC|nr:MULTISPECIES: DUF6233 domain-containing protein [Streptomycetaceae]MYX36774.1 hypothetical protein [Streptomyces sp. SID8377]